MGYHFLRRPVATGVTDISQGGILGSTKGAALSTGTFSTATGVSYGAFFKTTAAVIANRVVKQTSGGGVKHTTGSSGRRILGVALTSASAAGSTIKIGVMGIMYVAVSTAAVKRGSWLRATSGAASTGSQLGGTVKASTNNTQGICGMALTSAAAGAGARKILALITPIGRASTAA